MGHKHLPIGRSESEGSSAGFKRDRFRHSALEQSIKSGARPEENVSEVNANTIGGAWEENRGRRGSAPRRYNEDSPFENGGITNWGHRHGWDEHFYGSRRHGGAWMGPEHALDHRGKGPRGYSRADENIYEDVCEAIARSADVDGSEIEVEVRAGEVFLRGSVPDRRMKRMAELEIENISGVMDVQNQLTLKRGNNDVQEF
jgi:hypothetical protein